ncbi:MAG: hypothetical protein AAGF92_17750 [Myxococcota bacterium]
MDSKQNVVEGVESVSAEAELRPRVVLSDRKQPSEIKREIVQLLVDTSEAKLRRTSDAGVRAGDRVLVCRRGGFAQLQLSDEGQIELSPAAVTHILSELTDVAEWIVPKKDRKGQAYEVAGKPPKDLAEQIEANPPHTLPRIDTVVRMPVLGSAGRIYAIDGHYPDDRLWVQIDSRLELPSLPIRPSAEHINAARSLIMDELMGDFPFAGVGEKQGPEAEKAHALCAILQPFVRPIIDGPTPAYHYDAPTIGSGKSLLSRLVNIIAEGQEPSMQGWPTSEEERQKVIASKLIGDPKLIVFDNIPDGSTVDSSALAVALTAPIYEARILGRSVNQRLPNTCVWALTGNNIGVSQELARRVVRVRIDAEMAEPWTNREFRHELPTWAFENRSELVSACLVLVQAWVAAGMPKWSGEALGTFEAWSETMGGILGVAGVPGFLGNLEDARAVADVGTSEWVEFLSTWLSTSKQGGEDAIGDKAKAKRLMQLCTDNDLLEDVRGEGGERSQITRLGLALRGQLGRVYQVESEGEGTVAVRIVRPSFDKHAKSHVFKLEEVNR